MNKLLAALSVLFILLCPGALAYEKEAAPPVSIDREITIRDYGFASADKDSRVIEYGYVLQPEEARAANAERPLFYITFENHSSSTRALKLYIRGGRKYDCYWSREIAVAPHASYTFYGQGYSDARYYAGSWSVDVRGVKTVRFGLYAN